jgi:hypothetical protein
MSDRRRADRFAELLEQAEKGRRPHRRNDDESELVPLTDFARSLREVPEPSPSEEMRTGIRAMLLATIEREGLGATASEESSRPGATSQNALTGRTQVIAQVPTRGGGRARAAILIGVVAGVLASGVSLASTESAPGDALYPVKRTSEQAQLVLAGSDASRGRLHLEFAKSRLVEARLVGSASVASTLATMDAETTEGAKLLFRVALQESDAGSINEVTAFVAQQRAKLNELLADLPAANEPVQQSLDLLRAIEERANQLLAAIRGGCAAPTDDDLGPKPDC